MLIISLYLKLTFRYPVFYNRETRYTDRDTRNRWSPNFEIFRCATNDYGSLHIQKILLVCEIPLDFLWQLNLSHPNMVRWDYCSLCTLLCSTIYLNWEKYHKAFRLTSNWFYYKMTKINKHKHRQRKNIQIDINE